MGGASDRELIDRARGGDAEAFGLLVRRHQRRIFRLAVHLTRNASEAEDVTQETFVRAYQALDRFDGRSEPFTWLYRIAVNLSLNQIRARKTKLKTSLDDDARLVSLLAENRPSLSRNPEGSSDEKRIAQTLLDGIDALSDTLRTTLVLVCVDGVSHEDAAKILGCPEGTVAWRVHEARRKLRAYLAERGYGGEES
ncbi:MAG: sigma-70 family RNA polymerase sigma factor [Polyangiaceae bacterium]